MCNSGLEFDLLWKFLVLGCDVLLNDVDIVYLQNSCTTPAQEYDLRVSDGFDDPTAYGYDDVSEDPSMA